MKFKVGDIVRGSSRTAYCVTNTDMTKGEVVGVYTAGSVDDIRIKVLKHKTKPGEIGQEFSVNSRYFELVYSPARQKIVITTDGKTTLARLYDNGKVTKSEEAKCHPQDKFDFKEGAKRAFERLMKPEFEPYLMSDTGDNYGTLGTPTNMKDITGKPLFVGDVVHLFDDDHIYYGYCFVCDDRKEQFISGIMGSCKRDGTINNGWIAIKAIDYSKLKNGEKYDYIKAVLEE